MGLNKWWKGERADTHCPQEVREKGESDSVAPARLLILLVPQNPPHLLHAPPHTHHLPSNNTLSLTHLARPPSQPPPLSV